jgi:hypothetical protein
MQDTNGKSFQLGWVCAAVSQSLGILACGLAGGRNLAAGIFIGSVVMMAAPAAREIFQRHQVRRTNVPTPPVKIDNPQP